MVTAAQTMNFITFDNTRSSFISTGTYRVFNTELNPKIINTIIKGIVSDCNNIFLWHESKDINQKSLFPKFQLILTLRFQVMHDNVCFIAPIDYCVE